MSLDGCLKKDDFKDAYLNITIDQTKNTIEKKNYVILSSTSKHYAKYNFLHLLRTMNVN